MGNGHKTDKHKKDFINKWISPELKNEIIAMQTLLVSLQHPFMNTPIQNIGLPPDTLADIRNYAEDAVSAFDLLINNHLNSTSKHDIINAATDRIPNISVQHLISHCDAIVRGRLDKGGSNLTTPPTLEDAIDDAKSTLVALEIEMDKNLKSLHIVSINVPASLKLRHDMQKITDVAQTALTGEFKDAITRYSAKQVELDLKSMSKPSQFSVLIEKLKAKFWGNFDHQDVQQETPSPTRPKMLTLEFSAQTHIQNDPLRVAMLQPFFAQVAMDLSGDALATLIGERLSPYEEHTPNEKDVAWRNRKSDWIKIQTPNAPEHNL